MKETEMNADKEFYSKELLTGRSENWVSEIVLFTNAWLTEMRGVLEASKGVRVLDLGAGSCSTSLTISKHASVTEIVATDVSATRMEIMSKETTQIVGGDLSKLSFHEIDFNEDLPFPDDAFDLVVMDAALHHSRNIWHTLSEIGRVLKLGGHFVAQREAYVAPLTATYAFKRLLRSPEVAAGVSENAYLKSQYDYYLRVNGFSPRFQPIFPSLKFKLLFFLNGIAFSKYNIIARNEKAG